MPEGYPHEFGWQQQRGGLLQPSKQNAEVTPQNMGMPVLKISDQATQAAL